MQVASFTGVAVGGRGRSSRSRGTRRQLSLQLGISWTVDATTTVVDAPPALVAPPPADLEELHQLALTGNMRAIRERAAALATADAAFKPFCDKLQQLAGSYQSKAIHGLVKQHLEQSRTA